MESAAISKMKQPYLRFYFWFSISSTLESLCKNLLNQSIAFEDMALNVDTNKNQNLELLPGALPLISTFVWALKMLYAVIYQL